MEVMKPREGGSQMLPQGPEKPEISLKLEVSGIFLERLTSGKI